MDKSENVKNRIITVTTELIEQYGGVTNCITARMIAEKANAGLGLINYHFGSKENLITECVQRIIGKVVAGFHMERGRQTDKEYSTASASHVFHFLFEHAAISQISILGDFQNYTEDCNSVFTQYGLMRSFKDDIPEQEKHMLAFILTAAMQAAFSGRGTVARLLGYDFTKAADRNAYIKHLVDILFAGTVQGDESENRRV